MVLIELDLNIAQHLPSRAAGSATLHFPKLTLLFSSLWLGFTHCFTVVYFLVELRGDLINHHFKVAWVICIQIHEAAPSTADIGIGFLIPTSSGSSSGAPKVADLRAQLPPHPGVLRGPRRTLSQRKMPQPQRGFYF